MISLSISLYTIIMLYNIWTKNHEMDLNHDNKKEINTIKDTDVYNLLLKIPAGKVSTYGDSAKALGNPSVSRMIGRILGIIQTLLKNHVTEW